MRAFRQLLAIAFVVGSLCHEALQGQIPPFQSYVVRDGLPSNNVTALYQDSRGFLWIGTDNGLSRYDGIEFKNFTTTDGLPNLFITEIIERRDRPGTVWVGTIAGGIAKVEEGRLSTIPVGNNSITALHEDAMGTLWYSTQDRVYSIRNESTVVIENIPVGNYDIQNIGDSVLVFLGRTEILFYQLWEKTLRRVSLGLARDEYTSRMLIDTDGIVWMVTSARRLGRVGSTGISFRQLSGEFALSRGLPSQIIDDGRGNLWVTLPRGILRIDKVTGASTMIDASGKPNTLLSGPIMLDREENIWVGTNGDGLLKITDRRVLNISLGQVSSGSFNLTAASDTHGHIWVLTSSGLWEVYRSNSGAWKKHQHYSVPRANGVLIDQDGHLWESDATNGDYHCYEIVSRENSPSTLRKIRSISGDSLGGAVQGFTFAVDSKNTGWFAVHPTGLVEMNIRRGKVIRRFSTADGLLDDAPRAVLADRRGNVWSGTWTAGLSVLQPGADTFRTVLEFPGLAGSGVRSLHEDRRGSLWIGTRYGGLVRYQRREVHRDFR